MALLLHPLQSPLDKMTDYLRDAQLIHRATQERLTQRTTERQAQGKRGNGQPGAEHSALNRAVVVAAVGALEAFTEDLAITAQEHYPSAKPPRKEWYAVAGPNGMVQTPSPTNLRKLFWTFFRYDPMPAWDWQVRVSESETGGTNTWPSGTAQLAGADAFAFLDTMVKVRHGFAHQDKGQLKVHSPGIASQTTGGKISIHAHHATNAVSVLLQYAVLTTAGLAGDLGCTNNCCTRQFRWSTAMSQAGWEPHLVGTPASVLVRKTWRNPPPVLQ
ncbi:hypothetical protein [Streptomyces sp. NPDC090029]|uniref:hypothetical protein n=1 Tax=Streptomyces sp. NPDC090029 TaxID=3365924 RepID=UPI0038220811